MTASLLVAAPPTGVGRRGPSVLRHGGTLVWRGLVKTVRSPEALIDVTFQPIIFLLLFVYVFGGAIAGNTDSYLRFALPGVLVQTVLFASIGTGMNLAEDRQTGIFDRFRGLPISRAAPLVGAIGADLIRYLTSAVIMLAFGALLGFRLAPGAGAFSVLAALLLVMVMSFALCWVFTALAMVVRDPRSVQGIGMLILFPISFASTVFVPAETMPGWLRAWAEVNPVSAVAAAERALLTGGSAAGPVAVVLAWSLGIFAVFAPLAVTLYRRRA